MPNYDFKTLSPLDFENLSRDLIQLELGIDFESFKAGKDSGIDFRYSPCCGEKTILQVKHFVGSGTAKLIYHLEKSELPKVKKLSPQRYLICTSVSLSVLDKAKILKIFSPYILNESDIFGQEGLNALLEKHPKVEKSNFKLWLDSVNILEEILHSKITNFSRESLLAVKEKIKYFVNHPGVLAALDSLEKNNYCIIAGMPGIGKTILAEMLALKFLEKKFDIVRVLNSEEAFEVGFDKSAKFIYYDDFLGQTSSMEKMGKNEDQRLLELIGAIKRQKNSKLVLTTREYILNQACQNYEKLDKAFPELKGAIINLHEYSRKIRAQILYNHVHFSGMPGAHVDSLLSGRNYIKVVDHPNYNPRIVDTMTKKFMYEAVSAERYAETLISTLDNPEEIWRHAFENQISKGSRQMLVIMASVPYHIFYEDLLSLMGKGFGMGREEFRKSLKELENSFIDINQCGETYVVQYHNPSIKDFIKNYIYSDIGCFQQILGAVLFWEQIDWLWKQRRDSANKGKILSFMRKEVERLKLVFYDLAKYSDCGFYLFSSEEGCSAFGKSKTRYAQRVDVLLGFVREFLPETDPYSQTAVDTVKNALVSLLADAKSSKDDVWQIANSLLKHNVLSEEERLNISARVKGHLTSACTAIDDFDCIFDYIHEYPDSFTPEEKSEMEVRFNEVVDGVVSSLSDEDDPDEVRAKADALSYISDKLDLNLEDKAEILERHAREMEYEDPDEASERMREIKDSLPSDSLKEEFSDEQMDSIFSTLRDI